MLLLNHALIPARPPPCTKKLADSGITRVVVGIKDPSLQVSGIDILKKKGIEVKSGLLKKECRKLVKDFLKYRSQKKPYVTVKTAMSLDGKIATRSNNSRWISSPASRDYTMRLRGESDAIMVGATTARIDNPLLTYRLEKPHARDPVRVILDGNLSVSTDLDIIKKGTLIIAARESGGEKEKILKDKGVKIIKLPSERGKVNPADILSALYRENIMSLLIEGGSSAIGTFLDGGETDSIVFIYAPILIGGNKAPGVYGRKGIKNLEDKINISNINIFKIGEDIVVEGDII